MADDRGIAATLTESPVLDGAGDDVDIAATSPKLETEAPPITPEEEDWEAYYQREVEPHEGRKQAYQAHLDERVSQAQDQWHESIQPRLQVIQQENQRVSQEARTLYEQLQVMGTKWDGWVGSLEDAGPEEAQRLIARMPAEVQRGITALAKGKELLTEVFVREQVSARLQSVAGDGFLQGQAATVDWLMRQAFTEMGRGNAWAKHSAKLPQDLKTLPQALPPIIAEALKELREIAYKRGVSEARTAATEKAKVIERKDQGPMNVGGSAANSGGDSAKLLDPRTPVAELIEIRRRMAT